MAAPSYDIITVGGGIAASSLAVAMAGRGAKVLVLEREKQFKDRVHGEAVVPWGVAEANELGICGLLKEKCAHDVPFVEAGSGLRDPRATTPQQCRCCLSPTRLCRKHCWRLRKTLGRKCVAALALNASRAGPSLLCLWMGKTSGSPPASWLAPMAAVP